MKKTMIIALALVALTAIFTGCVKPAEVPAAPEPQQSAAPAETPSEQQSGQPTDSPSEKIAVEAKDAEGKLNGWIDNNSVEIQMTPSDFAAFRVTDVLDQMKGIEDGDKVKFSYFENEFGQMVITKIEKAQ